MSQLIETSVTEPADPSGRSVVRVLTLLRKQPAAAVGAGIIGLFVVLALIAPLIEPYSVTARTCAIFAHPSWHHWLGCDDGGVDVLSELLQGGRISMVVGATATVVSMAIGGGVGILSGYFGGWLDVLLMRITDYFLVIPALVLMIIIADVWGPSLFHVILVIGMLLWTSTARVIRAQVKAVKEHVYVKRARSIGASHFRVIVHHIIPQVGPLLIANTVLTVGVAIFFETALAFLGLSDPTQITWGKLIEFAFLQDAVTVGAWWTVVPAGVCITVLVIGCFLVGQAIEGALNPRLRTMHFTVGTWTWRAESGDR